MIGKWKDGAREAQGKWKDNVASVAYLIWERRSGGPTEMSIQGRTQKLSRKMVRGGIRRPIQEQNR